MKLSLLAGLGVAFVLSSAACTTTPPTPTPPPQQPPTTSVGTAAVTQEIEVDPVAIKRLELQGGLDTKLGAPWAGQKVVPAVADDEMTLKAKLHAAGEGSPKPPVAIQTNGGAQ